MVEDVIGGFNTTQVKAVGKQDSVFPAVFLMKVFVTEYIN